MVHLFDSSFNTLTEDFFSVWEILLVFVQHYLMALLEIQLIFYIWVTHFLVLSQISFALFTKLGFDISFAFVS